MRGALQKIKWGVIIILIITIIVGGVVISRGYLDSTLAQNYDEYYEVVKQGISNYDSTVDVKVKNYDDSIQQIDIVKDVLENHPEYLGNFEDYSTKYIDSGYYTVFVIEFSYLTSKEVLLDREKQVEDKIEEIISLVIKPEMNDYQKELALHDYIINNCKFDERYYTGNMPNESYSAYGTLIEGVSVCQGYAVAMDKLLKAVGIETILAVGEALDEENNSYIPHAWNLVKIDGEYYHLDLTWDDPVMELGANKLRYSYFNIPDEKIELNHKWNKDRYPSCTSTTYSFDNLGVAEKDADGNEIIVVNNYDEFYNAFKSNFSKNINNRTYNIKNFDGIEDNLCNSISRVYESLGKSGTYRYTIEIDEISSDGYVKISF